MTVESFIALLGILAAASPEIAQFVKMLLAGHPDAAQRIAEILPAVGESEAAEILLTAQHDTDPAPRS